MVGTGKLGTKYVSGIDATGQTIILAQSIRKADLVSLGLQLCFGSDSRHMSNRLETLSAQGFFGAVLQSMSRASRPLREVTHGFAGCLLKTSLGKITFTRSASLL
jgi:hypothetical protein